MNTIDLNLLTKIDKAPIFQHIKPDLMNKLNALPHTKNRLKCCLKFSWYLSGDKDIFRSPNEDLEVLREGYMRAALAEYASVEETLKRDVKTLANNPKPLMIRNVKHPLPHLLKELRNLEIHVVSSTISSKDIKGFIQWETDDIKDHEYTNFIVDDFTLSKFNMSSNAKFYQPKDIDKAIKWFNSVQQLFGINEVIRLGVEVLAEELVDNYKLG